MLTPRPFRTFAPRSRYSPVMRGLTTSNSRSSAFSRPGPPPLPPADQAEFERQVKAAEVAPTVSSAAGLSAEELEHPDLRRGPEPEFEGEVNPKTGEVGGPKRDPFIAGNNDWQFGRRVTDF